MSAVDWVSTVLLGLGALVMLAGHTASGDSMLVPTVELHEEDAARYVLEARAAPAVTSSRSVTLRSKT